MDRLNDVDERDVVGHMTPGAANALARRWDTSVVRIHGTPFCHVRAPARFPRHVAVMLAEYWGAAWTARAEFDLEREEELRLEAKQCEVDAVDAWTDWRAS